MRARNAEPRAKSKAERFYASRGLSAALGENALGF